MDSDRFTARISLMTTTATLDGLTILRFAHAFESGGGTERYLDDLDRILLARNALTVVRLHLTRKPEGYGPVAEPLGRGTLMRMAVPILAENGSSMPDTKSSLTLGVKQKVRDWGLYNPLVWHAVGARWTASRRLPRQPGQAVGAGQAAAKIFRERRVNLVMLHFFGGADAGEVLSESRQACVPVALLNHYSNDRFLNLPIRKHAMLADGVAGVNGLGLPGYVRNGFTNLSDGIDTDFFRRANARPLAQPPVQPVILLPARVVREKGHLDLVRAAALLRQSGHECCLAFAGRLDSSGFVDELRTAIAKAGLDNNVRFLGDLSVEQLRDWYAASAVVAFPTYHHEGLGRVIVEAQAMEVPVVAYATGGVPDGIDSGRTGYLVRTGEIAGLADHLQQLLASPTLRATMGRAGRAAAESRFSLTALAERHEQFYLKIINQ